jgi:predicted phosphodiesterase
MNIAVISDLHVGSGDAADGFGHHDADFLRFLRFLEGNFERIVLLGDIWETLACRKLGDAALELRRARAAHPEIARRFELPQYSYVHGNHDLVAGIVEGAPEHLVLEADGTRLLFTHGHHHDALFVRGQWLAELGIWAGGWLLRLGQSPLYRAFSAIDATRTGVAADAGRCTFQRWAVRAAEAFAADVVVTGHTHLPTRAEHGRRLFLNSGSCAEGRFCFSSIDTKSGCYGVQTSW